MKKFSLGETRRKAKRMARSYVNLFALSHGIRPSVFFRKTYSRCAEYLVNANNREASEVVYCLKAAGRVYDSKGLPNMSDLKMILEGASALTGGHCAY